MRCPTSLLRASHASPEACRKHHTRRELDFRNPVVFRAQPVAADVNGLASVQPERPARASIPTDVSWRHGNLSSPHGQPLSASALYASAPSFRARWSLSHRSQSPPVPADLVKIITHGTLTSMLRVQHAPDFNIVCDALGILQTATQATSDNAARRLDAVKHELKAELENTTDTVDAIAAYVQQNMSAGEEAETAAREAVEVGTANLEMTRRIRDAGLRTGVDASRYIEYTSS
jgi:hypothetical protein